MKPNDILKLPYGRLIKPEPDGSFFAQIVEFPGCFATGESAAEAMSNLEDVAVSWVASVIASGRAVPPPAETMDYSGRLVLRMPKSLHQKASERAIVEGVSLNHFIVACVAENVGSWRVQRSLASQGTILMGTSDITGHRNTTFALEFTTEWGLKSPVVSGGKPRLLA